MLVFFPLPRPFFDSRSYLETNNLVWSMSVTPLWFWFDFPYGESLYMTNDVEHFLTYIRRFLHMGSNIIDYLPHQKSSWYVAGTH